MSNIIKRILKNIDKISDIYKLLILIIPNLYWIRKPICRYLKRLFDLVVNIYYKIMSPLHPVGQPYTDKDVKGVFHNTSSFDAEIFNVNAILGEGNGQIKINYNGSSIKETTTLFESACRAKAAYLHTLTLRFFFNRLMVSISSGRTRWVTGFLCLGSILYTLLILDLLYCIVPVNLLPDWLLNLIPLCFWGFVLIPALALSISYQEVVYFLACLFRYGDIRNIRKVIIENDITFEIKAPESLFYICEDDSSAGLTFFFALAKALYHKRDWTYWHHLIIFEVALSHIACIKLDKLGKFSGVDHIDKKLNAINKYITDQPEKDKTNALFSLHDQKNVHDKNIFHDQNNINNPAYRLDPGKIEYFHDVGELFLIPIKHTRLWLIIRGLLLLLMIFYSVIIPQTFIATDPKFDVWYMNGRVEESIHPNDSREIRYAGPMIFTIEIKETGFLGGVCTEVKLLGGGNMVYSMGSVLPATSLSECCMGTNDKLYFRIVAPYNAQSSFVPIAVIVTNKTGRTSRLDIVLRCPS